VLIKRYLEILSLIPFYSIDLKVIEDKIKEKYGVSRNQAYNYLMKLKREGLIDVRRRGRRGSYYVRPSKEGKMIVLQISREWSL
jgi:DNA-binding PadR family transcriptional regulator